MGFLSRLIALLKLATDKIFRNTESVVPLDCTPLAVNDPGREAANVMVGENKNHVICASYSVRGKNPATNRMKRVFVIVESTATEAEIQQKSGLLPPYEIAANPPAKPTENQIAYAKRMNFSFPPDATMKDASIFLSRLENDMPPYSPATPDGMLHYVIGKGIEVPAYAGRDETRNLYFSGIAESERAAYFCMKVYSSISKKPYCILEDAELWERMLFDEFAKQHNSDKAFIRSLSYYSGVDLPFDNSTISKKLKAYDIASDFLTKRIPIG